MPATPRSAPLTDPLVELSPGPAVPPTFALAQARRSLEAALVEMLAVPDDAMERPWRWRPDDPDNADVRYGLYRIHESLEESIAAIARGRTSTGGDGVGPAVPRLATATMARWALHGALVPLSIADFDADPGGGEWTVRRTMGHVVASQRSYGWYSAWYLSRAGLPDAGQRPPAGALPDDHDEETEGAGEISAVRARLDGLLDAAAERFGALDDAALAVPGRWSGLPVTIDFRLGRLGSHVREHTIQVDKTLALIGRPLSEVERLVRLACETYGRLEATIFARPADDVERPLAGGSSAASIVEAAAAEVARIARSVREASSA